MHSFIIYFFTPLATLGILLASERPRHKCPTSTILADVQSGTFKSPGFPVRYHNNMECVVTIKPKEGHVVVLTIEHFSVEQFHDYVIIYQVVHTSDGDKVVKQSQISGSELTQTVFYSSLGGGFKIVFRTDFSESNLPGYMMSFTRFRPKINQFYCPQVAYQASGKIEDIEPMLAQSTTYADCVFQVNSTKTSEEALPEAVEITVKNMSMTGSLQILETENFNAESKRRQQPLKVINGFEKFPVSIISRTSSVTILTKRSRFYDIEFRTVENPCKCGPDKAMVSDVPITVTSPGWPLEYCDNHNCFTNFVINSSTPRQPNEIQAIRFKLNEMAIESLHDYLAFYEDEMQLKKYTPAPYNDDNKINYFTVFHENAGTKFITDNSIVAKGYNMTIDVINMRRACQCPLLTSKLEFHIPPNCRFIDCFWGVTAPNASQRYRAVFTTRFKFYDNFEFLQFYSDQDEGPGVDSVKLVPSMSMQNTDFEYTVSIKTDSMVRLWYHRETENSLINQNHHILIDFKWMEQCLCGPLHLTATSDWTSLTSPDYPAPYCENMNCTYEITAPEGMNVEVNVTLLELEFNQDTLSFFDGDSMNSTRMHLLTGVEYLMSPFQSSVNVMTVHFKSDVSLATAGFVFQYRSTKSSEQDEHQQMAGFRAIHAFLFCLIVALVAGGFVLFRRYQYNREGFFETIGLSGLENRFVSMNSLIQNVSALHRQENQPPATS